MQLGYIARRTRKFGPKVFVKDENIKEKWPSSVQSRQNIFFEKESNSIYRQKIEAFGKTRKSWWSMIKQIEHSIDRAKNGSIIFGWHYCCVKLKKGYCINFSHPINGLWWCAKSFYIFSRVAKKFSLN